MTIRSKNVGSGSMNGAKSGFRFGHDVIGHIKRVKTPTEYVYARVLRRPPGALKPGSIGLEIGSKIAKREEDGVWSGDTKSTGDHYY